MVFILIFFFSILDIHATEEIAGDNMDGWSFLVCGMYGMITDTADEAAALYLDIDVSGYKQFDAATERVDVDFFILCDDSLAHIHSDAAAEDIQTGSVEGLAIIDVLIATIMNRAADALAVLADGQRAL